MGDVGQVVEGREALKVVTYMGHDYGTRVVLGNLKKLGFVERRVFGRKTCWKVRD